MTATDHATSETAALVADVEETADLEVPMVHKRFGNRIRAAFNPLAITRAKVEHKLARAYPGYRPGAAPTAAQRGPAWQAKYLCSMPECGLDHAGKDGEPGWHASVPIETESQDISSDLPADGPWLSAQIVVIDDKPQAYGRKTEVWVHYGPETGALSPAQTRQVARDARAFAERLEALANHAEQLAAGDFEGDPEIARLDREAEDARIRRITEGRP
ncbi:hypothetical protein SCAB_48551 [Streptomyces scabiei 87.22]|uniref:Uncharacterized protein n=1 Tax=Streptomyces scabiei (strain 87.22) TaxID=680198 RepID=C9ZFC0_STRSW|nr:hypothetical protein [Streptomyces scabiei]MDX2891446.1 hypothetical protein [Streptomyces scabiei]MDX2904895.1 hypothetical protein [Streptomyces scabiei]MDX2994490.1 hypothetical protein [Streptomyces scabiei]MDX3084734.1 hypothetical protein [Streptomyces scabiei]MDX3137862.1 hypothetical protein [Streptomyces scabiei]